MRANALSAIRSASIGKRPSADFFNAIGQSSPLATLNRNPRKPNSPELDSENPHEQGLTKAAVGNSERDGFPEMTTNTTGADSARPDDEEMRLYQRAYLAQQQADTLYLRWEAAMAHALLLEQDPGRVYPEYGHLNGRQLGEGARCTARRFALVLSEPPAMSAAILELKITIYEALARDEDEMRRSRAAAMIEMAMHLDARDLGIVLTKLPLGMQSEGSH